MRPHLRPLFLSAALVVSAGTLTAQVHAQNAPDQAAARSLFDEGARLYAAGSYPEACAKLEASYHLLAGIGTRGKLAECYEKIGRTASAWAMYREVIALASKAGDPERAKVATDRAAMLEPKLAHLTITLAADRDVPGLIIKRGDKAVERGALSTAVAIDPGKLSFEISAPGRITQNVDVDVAPASATTFAVPALDLAPVPPPPAAAPVAGDTAGPASGSGNTWQRPTGIIVGGVGVVTVAVGGILALVGKSSYDSAFSSGHCDHGTNSCDATGQSQTDGARSQANVGGILLGVGAALAVGGGVLFFLAPNSPTPATGLRLVPALAPGVASLDVVGGF
jgi:hypothetical protein